MPCALGRVHKRGAAGQPACGTLSSLARRMNPRANSESQGFV